MLPDSVVDATIEFYHKILNHPGHNALLKGLKLYYHQDLGKKVKYYSCHDCQFKKKTTQGIGHLPPRDASIDIWQQVDVDLIGSWTFNIRDNLVELSALT